LDAGLVADLIEAASGHPRNAAPAAVKVSADGELQRIDAEVPERRHTGVLDLLSEPQRGQKVVQGRGARAAAGAVLGLVADHRMSLELRFGPAVLHAPGAGPDHPPG